MPGLNLLLRESLRNRREQLRRQSSHSSIKCKMHAAGIARGAQSSALPLPREQQGDQQLKPLHSNRRKSPMTGTPGLPLSVAAPCACARVSTGLSAAQRSSPSRCVLPSAQPYNTRAHIYIRTHRYVRTRGEAPSAPLPFPAVPLGQPSPAHTATFAVPALARNWLGGFLSARRTAPTVAL